MRLFYAILLSEEVLDALTDAQERLRAETVGGRLSRRENLHLTLSFLGETERLDAAKRAGEGLRSKPFSLSLRGAGSFRSGDSELFWAGAELSEPLRALQKELAGRLRAEGFVLDEKPFRPHLTLMRQAIPVPSFDRKAFAASIPQLSMRVENVSLMCSERVKGVLTYTELFRGRLWP